MTARAGLLGIEALDFAINLETAFGAGVTVPQRSRQRPVHDRVHQGMKSLGEHGHKWRLGASVICGRGTLLSSTAAPESSAPADYACIETGKIPATSLSLAIAWVVVVFLLTKILVSVLLG